MVTIHSYPTPDGATDAERVCRSFSIRASLIPALDDWLEKIAHSWMWEAVGDMTPEEVAEELEAAFAQLQAGGCAVWIGEVKWIATAVPEWCLLCDGTEYDKEDYPLLAEALDSAYEVDPLTFRVPDLLFRFPRGAVVPGTEGGADSVTLTETELPTHGHGTHSHGVLDPGIVDVGANPPALIYAQSELGLTGSTDSSSVPSAGDGEAFDITPPYHDLVPVIVAKYPGAV